MDVIPEIQSGWAQADLGLMCQVGKGYERGRAGWMLLRDILA